MSRIPIHELRRMGCPKRTSKRRRSRRRHSGGTAPGAVDRRHRRGRPAARPAQPEPARELTDRALRKRGTYDQAALLLDQQALQERSPERAVLARQAAKMAKELSAAQQLEFDFFGGGNVSIAFQYQDAVTERLFAAAKTPAQAFHAQAVLWQITRNLGWQSYECTKPPLTCVRSCGPTKATWPARWTFWSR